MFKKPEIYIKRGDARVILWLKNVWLKMKSFTAQSLTLANLFSCGPHCGVPI